MYTIVSSFSIDYQANKKVRSKHPSLLDRSNYSAHKSKFLPRNMQNNFFLSMWYNFFAPVCYGQSFGFLSFWRNFGPLSGWKLSFFDHCVCYIYDLVQAAVLTRVIIWKSYTRSQVVNGYEVCLPNLYLDFYVWHVSELVRSVHNEPLLAQSVIGWWCKLASG